MKMDLNQEPSDQMVNGVKFEEIKKMGNFYGVVNEDSKIESFQMEQRYREVEGKDLALELEIRNKDLELEAIKDKIRVLDSEKLRIEDEIKGLKMKKKEKTGFRGVEIGGEMMCDEFCWEVSRVDELMVENKVLECEKNAAIKEVEVWKQKCMELEVRVVALEGRLKCLGKSGISIGIEGGSPMFDEDVGGSKDFGSVSQLAGEIDGALPLEVNTTPCVGTPDKLNVLPEGTSSNKVHVKRRLSFQNEKSCADKIALPPPTPVGARPSSAAIIDIIDSDNECDVHAKYRPDSQRLENSCMMSDGIMDEEEKSSGIGTAPFNARTTKKRRDQMVVMSDDDSEGPKHKPSRRVRKVELENSDNEGHYDDSHNDTTPIRQVLNKVMNASENEDDEDNIPISQLKRKRDQGSNQPRRRLVKHGKGEHEDRTHEMGNDSDESTDDESENSVRSLSSFIVNDSDVEDVEDDASKDLEDDVSKDSEDNSCELDETSDSDLDYGKVISKLGSRRERNTEWIGEGDMLADFGKNPELCMKAVCALYRQQTNEEKAFKASLIHNGRGFSRHDATRGTYLGEFLTNGDPNGDLVKSVEDMQEFDSKGIEDCHKLAKHYSKQLFKIYESGEDLFFL